MVGKKKFDACLLRITSGECIVVEWNQLVTTSEKSKLGVGSAVGYKTSANKREKVLRGTIVLIGSIRTCEQQLKLFNAKMKKKQVEENESDGGEEENEEKNDSNDKDPPDSNDDASSESDDECLQINEQEENDNHETQSVSSMKLKENSEKHKNQVRKSKEISSNNNNNNDDDESPSTSSSGKRSLIDTETEELPPKRRMISLARFEEIQLENIRLKKQNEKYRNEWMPRPVDPAVIRYIVHMGELFSEGDEAEEKGEKLAGACSILNIEEQDVNRWQKANGTKTARAIVRAFYPPNIRTNITANDIDPAFRKAVHDVVNVYHGMECLTEGKINESINNVFRSAKSQQKEKSGTAPPTQSTIHSTKTMKKKKRININDKENVIAHNQ